MPTVRTLVALAVVTIGLAVALLVVMPTSMGTLPAGMHTPIVAFELARTPAEIEAMFGPDGSPERAGWVIAMDRGNRADFAFLLAYGAALFAISRALRRHRGGVQPSLGEWLAPVAPLADALENLQLLEITAALGGDYTTALGRLAVFTWVKWSAIAVVMLTWVPTLARMGVLGIVAGLTIILTAIATAAAVIVRGLAAEAMGLGVVFSLLTAVVVVVLRAREARALP